MATHAISGHKRPGYKCDCGQTCGSSLELTRHVQRQHVVITYTCTTCQQVFTSCTAALFHVSNTNH